ncbi:MAG: hypothetical protein K0S09_2289 [Sphingobacteriaceae bacterium]|nr:hypothetical protein [Sphingobacteriaceae bacterium]
MSRFDGPGVPRVGIESKFSPKGNNFETIEDHRKETIRILDEIFQESRTNAEILIYELPILDTHNSVILHLYDVACQCLLFGLYGAANMQTSILGEFVIRYTIFKKQFKNEIPFTSANWKRVENLNFSALLWKLRDEKLLSIEEIEILDTFRKNVRNNYAHFKLSDLAGDYVFKKMKFRNLITQEVFVDDLPASVHPFFQILSKNNIDKESALDNLKMIVSIAVKLLSDTGDILQYPVSSKNKSLGVNPSSSSPKYRSS